MKLDHSARIDAPVERVWAIVSDVPRAGRLVPGVGPVEPLGAYRYRGTLRVQIGPVRLDLAGDIEVTSRDETARTAALRLDAADHRLGGAVRATMRLALTQATPSTTDIRIETDAQVLGRIGELGEPIIRRKADRIVSELIANLAREASS